MSPPRVSTQRIGQVVEFPASEIGSPPRGAETRPGNALPEAIGIPWPTPRPASVGADGRRRAGANEEQIAKLVQLKMAKMEADFKATNGRTTPTEKKSLEESQKNGDIATRFGMLQDELDQLDSQKSMNDFFKARLTRLIPGYKQAVEERDAKSEKLERTITAKRSELASLVLEWESQAEKAGSAHAKVEVETMALNMGLPSPYESGPKGEPPLNSDLDPRRREVQPGQRYPFIRDPAAGGFQRWVPGANPPFFGGAEPTK